MFHQQKNLKKYDTFINQCK